MTVADPGTRPPAPQVSKTPPADHAAAVLYDVRDSGVAVITFNRPDRMNAWNSRLATGFYTHLDTAEADPAVKVIVVTGSGRAFCAGADMGNLNSIGDLSVESASKTDVSKLVAERHPHFVTSVRKPVIAAINGACAGMGLAQALMCDIRFAAAGAKLTTSFARRGLIAEYGISWILPRLVGFGAAMDLLISGRTFTAEEAAELGMVKEVVAPWDLMNRVIAYAEDIAANCAPNSMAIIKEQLYGDTLRGVVDTSNAAERLMHDSMLRPDFVEGITAFFEKRIPNFPALSQH